VNEVPVGTTVSFISPDKLVFVTKTRLNLGEFVSVRDVIADHERVILARVNDLVFSDWASFGSTLQALGTPRIVWGKLLDIVSGEDELFLVAQCEVLGMVTDDNSLTPLTTALKPGLGVVIPPKAMLESILNLPSKSAVDVGRLSLRDDVRVLWSIDGLSGGMLIVGETGTGKTQMARRIAQASSRHGFSVVVVDPTGEWESFRGKGDVIQYFSLNETKIDFSYLKPEDLSHFVNASGYEESILTGLFSDERFSSIEDINQVLQQADIREGSKTSLLNKIERAANELHMMFSPNALKFKDILGSPGVMVLDLSKWLPEQQRLAVRYLFQDVLEHKFSERGEVLVKPALIVVDDADNLVSDAESAFVENLFRMGRKFNVGGCLISQHPSRLSQALRTSCRNLFVFTLSSMDDLQAIDRQFGIPLERLRKLGPGQMLVWGSGIRLPIMVDTAQ
jgi:Cdc6-like AAA superfamily ATPase